MKRVKPLIMPDGSGLSDDDSQKLKAELTTRKYIAHHTHMLQMPLEFP